MMTLYSGTVDPYSHRCRIVLFEKGMDFEVIDVDLTNKTEDLAVLNPYNAVPVLVERDLILSEANIINEYIDERFPHPQLMPADPVMRARARLFLYNFEKDLFDHIKDIESDDEALADKARATIRDNLTQIVPIFSKQNYYLAMSIRCWMLLLRRFYGVWVIMALNCQIKLRHYLNMQSVCFLGRCMLMQ
jgi:stringent starvation protein A